ETRLAGQVEAGLGAQADHHEVAAHGRAVVKGDADVRIVLHGDLCGAVAGQQLDAVVGEQLLVPLGDARRELGGAEHVVGEHEGDVRAIPRQGRGELGADISAADHHCARPVGHQVAQRAVVRYAAEVVYAIVL